MILLYLHLISAGLTALAVITAFYLLFRRNNGKTRSMFSVIAWLACADIISGSLLSINNHSPAMAYCRNIGLYTIVLVAIETMLWAKVRKIEGKTLLPVIKQTVFASIAAIILTFVTLI